MRHPGSRGQEGRAPGRIARNEGKQKICIELREGEAWLPPEKPGRASPGVFVRGVKVRGAPSRSDHARPRPALRSALHLGGNALDPPQARRAEGGRSCTRNHTPIADQWRQGVRPSAASLRRASPASPAQPLRLAIRWR